MRRHLPMDMHCAAVRPTKKTLGTMSDIPTAIAAIAALARQKLTLMDMSMATTLYLALRLLLRPRSIQHQHRRLQAHPCTLVTRSPIFLTLNRSKPIHAP